MADTIKRPAGDPVEGTSGKLRRAITGPLLFAFIVGDVLGAGIYALMGVLAIEVGGMLWLPLIIALVLALLTAGSYAELVTKYPRAGGAAVFAERAFKHPLVSFLVGYCMLAAGVTSAAGLAIAFAGDYFTTFIDLPVTLVAVAFLLLVGALNARGIRESMGANLVMTAIELSGLIIVVAAVAWFMTGGGGDTSRVLELPEGAGLATATLAGAIIAFYSFVGFETSANIIEEVKNPSRVYPVHSSRRSSPPESYMYLSASQAPSPSQLKSSANRRDHCSRSSRPPASVYRQKCSASSRSSRSQTERSSQ